MNAEMQTQMANIMSILQELMAMENAEAGGNGGMGSNPDGGMNTNSEKTYSEDEMRKAIKEMLDQEMASRNAGKAQDETKMDEMKKAVKKALEDTQSEGSTASDNAEERIDETNTELTEGSLMEVAKALLAATAKKSAPKSEDPIVMLAKEIASIRKSQTEHSDAINGILNGLGVSKQLEKIEKSATPEPKKPVMGDGQLEQLFKSILEGNKGQEKEEKTSQSRQIRKNLRGVAEGFIPNRSGRF